MNIEYKMNCQINLSKLKNINNIKSTLEFSEHFIKITFLSLSLPIKSLISGLLNPLFHSKNNEYYYINYSLIKSFSSNIDTSIINCEIINPVLNSNISFSLSKFENIGFFRKKISKDILKKIIVFTQKKIYVETKYLIERFLSLLDILKDCLDPQKEENPQVENILLYAYLSGKKFYEKYTLIYKQNNKLRKKIDKKLFDKLKTLDILIPEQELMKKNLVCANFESLINEFKIRTSYFIEESIILFLQIISLENNVLNLNKIKKSVVTSNLMSIQKENKITFDLELTNSSFGHNNLSFNLSNPKLNNSNSLTLNKFKTKNLDVLAQLNLSKVNINKSEDEIIKNNYNTFNIFNKNNENNINNNIINKVESVSTEQTSKKELGKNKYRNVYLVGKELLETPKFQSSNKLRKQMIKNKNLLCKNNSMKNDENENENNQKNTLKEISKQINELIKIHSLVPPVDVFNIFCNTAEIIYRKFFEICFKTFLGEIFYFEMDKDNLIRNDELYNYFMYLRNLKNILFSEKNKSYFSCMFLMGDDFK